MLLKFVTLVILMQQQQNKPKPKAESRKIIYSSFPDLKGGKLVNPIASNFFGQQNTTTEKQPAKENGNFDFIGRDIIRETTKHLSQFTDTIKRSFSTATGLSANKTSFQSNLQVIYPGTKWCGQGNISSSYEDLGRFASVDRCCRQHDMCPDGIPGESKKYGLENTGLFTRSHCDCDDKFYECLKGAKSSVANRIGFSYFTVLGPQCFRKDFPIIDCLEKKQRKCVKYRKDTKRNKVYQWFDSPPF